MSIKIKTGTAQDTARTMNNIDSEYHVRGQSIYVDDIPVRHGTLYACAYGSSLAHGKIATLDLSEAKREPGVIRILTAQDIPGENQIGGIIADEPLLAEKEVHYRGQPIALVIAETEAQARNAVKKIKIEIDPLPVITDPREAFAKGHLLSPSRTFTLGDSQEAFGRCRYVFQGRAETGGQEHLYIETQGAYAYPTEHGSLRITSSTQGPTQVQRAVARVLGVAMNKVEVEVTRLGGGFGGKEDQANAWGAMVALAAYLLHRPVKYVLHRMEDMRMTGKRNPYSSDYKIGLDKDLKILAYEATFYQNGGAAADLSPAILERTLFHLNSSYFIPNVTATAHSCRTNTPPNTAFRGFGGPQGMFVIEAAIDHAAAALKVDRDLIQDKNLLQDGDTFPYGQIAAECEARQCWQQARERYQLEKMKQEVANFNAAHKEIKKGLALMPICFGISFTNTQMNHARALVHVYADGSVGISTGAVEMGQGVNTKLLQVAAKTFGIAPERIKIEPTNTTRVANTSPSAASSTTDLNGKALVKACEQILERLRQVAAQVLEGDSSVTIAIQNEQIIADGNPTDLQWGSLVQQALARRVNLSAKGHYATPRIHFDKNTEKGHPFAYHVYGTAIFTVTLDCIRGTYEFDSVRIVHDYGASMNQMIDLGQTEGGLVQGMGWMTMEELLYDKKGHLLSDALSTYKVPDIYAVPKSIEVHFLHTHHDNLAIFRSKAVGEPPLLYGIGAYFAIRNALKAFRPQLNMPYSAPVTPEKVLLAAYPC